eukprot:CAMPEP_0117863124 /NCGR_PEP_ID=MMETSP0950-20121206/5402_1 /TAXON_ID=44440 /ORGANISM="Chattonella subsalsa, Strain CCMP2191" /LENGTH=561 /DNA_ID=CAMNT_0005713849 /DNA_START=54 /DNA_END=1737 /DNA_ORIENTATION=+
MIFFDDYASKIYPYSRSIFERKETNNFFSSSTLSFFEFKPSFDHDIIIVGGGHNALVSAAYLSKAGLDVLVLERRHVLGGAAVTEEIFPGFKFSRASYLAGLLRPQVIKELELKKYGFKYLPRDPTSFTPTKKDSPLEGKYLMLGSNAERNYESIAQFSEKDAMRFQEYESLLSQMSDIIQPFLDCPPPNIFEGSIASRVQSAKNIYQITKAGMQNTSALVPLYELFTAPAKHILDRWFESDILKATLATDSVIGSMKGPQECGSGYVLLHHVMGAVEGKKGVWAYVQGGMGSVSNAIVACASKHGATLVTDCQVQKVLHGNGTAIGVKANGNILTAKYAVLLGCNPFHGFFDLLDQDAPLPRSFRDHIFHADYSCGAFKINCAVDELPNFESAPTINGKVGKQHCGTIHFESTVAEIETAANDAAQGIPAERPVIEMTIPSSLDTTISPAGKHVVQLFVQYAPYKLHPSLGSWEDLEVKEEFADRVFGVVDEFCPNFSKSVIGRDVLSPWDLEQIFGLRQGNIFHGSLSIHQLGYARPAPGYSSYRTPLEKLYLCASGAH